MSSDSNTNDDLALGRKLTDVEGKEIRLRLFPFLVKANEQAIAKAQKGDDDEFVDETNSEEDLNDFIDFIIAMINNSKTSKQCVEELTEMDMPFCPPPVAQRIQEELASYMQQITTSASEEGGGGDDDGAGAPAGDPTENQAEENEVGEADDSGPPKKVRFYDDC